jgi:hypothetical protein
MVNTITKHSIFATLIMLIALGGVGASAAQLIAPEEYKPSKLWQKNFSKEKELITYTDSSSSSQISSTQSSTSSSPTEGYLNKDEFIVQGGGQMRFNEDAGGGIELKKVKDGKIYVAMNSLLYKKADSLNFGQKVTITGYYDSITKDADFTGGSGNAEFIIINISNITVVDDNSTNASKVSTAPKNIQGMEKVVSNSCDPEVFTIDIPDGIVSYSKNISDFINPTGEGLFDNVSMTITSKKLNLSNDKKAAITSLQNYLDTGIAEELWSPEYSFNQYCTIGGTGRVEFSNKKITYPGTDIARISVAGYGQELPGDVVVEIFAKKGDDYIQLRKPVASIIDANTIPDYSNTNFGNCEANLNCVQDYVKTNTELKVKVDQAVKDLLATFEL